MGIRRRKNKQVKDLQLTMDRVFRFARIYKMSSTYHLPLGCGFRGGGGFTLIEIIVVVVILAIASAMAIPMFSSAAGTQASAAANMIAADMEYARSMAISRGQNYSVVFDTAAESYQIEDQLGAVIEHPVKKGFDYIVNFSGERSLDAVDIVSADFAGTGRITFDFLGSCDNGGTVSLQAGDISIDVMVEPVTGFISISN